MLQTRAKGLKFIKSNDPVLVRQGYTAREKPPNEGQRIVSRIAIIPARGGSKRIPRKNIRDFFGQPIIAYPIRAALDSGCFDEVMVSTEDEEIAEVARKFGASVPFMRSAENAQDHIGTVEVLLEVLEQYAEQGRGFSDLCCMYPCNPFATPDIIRESFEFYQEVEKKARGAFIVTEINPNVWRGFRVRDNKFSMLWPENYHQRTQDLETFFVDAAQLYWLNPRVLYGQKRLFSEDGAMLVRSALEAQDIDTEEDWQLAEVKYQAWRNHLTRRERANSAS